MQVSYTSVNIHLLVRYKPAIQFFKGEGASSHPRELSLLQNPTLDSMRKDRKKPLLSECRSGYFDLEKQIFLSKTNTECTNYFFRCSSLRNARRNRRME